MEGIFWVNDFSIIIFDVNFKREEKEETDAQATVSRL